MKARMFVAAMCCVALSSGAAVDRTRADGLAAWEHVHAVLISPRCLNCHTATNHPQQGDDRRRHSANVIRGPGGKGVAGLHCAGCHQAVNADSTGVPGNPNWHLAPLSMKWQDVNDRPLSSAAVCRAVTDRSKNHGLDGAALLKHHAEDTLVLWAWNPGRPPDGTPRTLPPLVGERPIVTIEGIGRDRVGRTVQDAWVDLDVVQCGYCQSGQIMSVVALLK